MEQNKEKKFKHTYQKNRESEYKNNIIKYKQIIKRIKNINNNK